MYPALYNRIGDNYCNQRNTCLIHHSYGTRSVPGSSYATGCDVLDETGNVVMQGLGSCYSYYDNSLNALPDHVFVARRGFYYGWMDTDGNWLYCQSIFSSVNADDELGY